MAKLTTAQRKQIPSKKFGLPNKRAYPLNDVAHAINAKARATQQRDAGNLSAGEHAEIVSKADRMIYGRDN
jgi:hypothetical protein